MSDQDTGNTTNRHRYYAMNRPDAVPKGYADWQSWYPPRPVILPDGDRKVFGFADYDNPLTFDQVWGMDMLPAAPVEQTRYLLWLDAGRDDTQAKWIEEDWRPMPREDLQALSDDHSRRATLILRLIDYESNGDQ